MRGSGLFRTLKKEEEMSRKRYTPEQIIGKLREAEVQLSQVEGVGVICRSPGIRSRAQGQAAQWEDILHAEGGQGADRAIEENGGAIIPQ